MLVAIVAPPEINLPAKLPIATLPEPDTLLFSVANPIDVL